MTVIWFESETVLRSNKSFRVVNFFRQLHFQDAESRALARSKRIDAAGDCDTLSLGCAQT